MTARVPQGKPEQWTSRGEERVAEQVKKEWKKASTPNLVQLVISI